MYSIYIQFKAIFNLREQSPPAIGAIVMAAKKRNVINKGIILHWPLLFMLYQIVSLDDDVIIVEYNTINKRHLNLGPILLLLYTSLT